MPTGSTSANNGARSWRWNRVLSSILGGVFGIAVLIGLASTIGWTLNALGWSPG